MFVWRGGKNYAHSLIRKHIFMVMPTHPARCPEQCSAIRGPCKRRFRRMEDGRRAPSDAERYGTGTIVAASLRAGPSSGVIRLMVRFPEHGEKDFQAGALTETRFFSDMQRPSGVPGLDQTLERLGEERGRQEELAQQQEKEREELKGQLKEDDLLRQSPRAVCRKDRLLWGRIEQLPPCLHPPGPHHGRRTPRPGLGLRRDPGRLEQGRGVLPEGQFIPPQPLPKKRRRTSRGGVAGGSILSLFEEARSAWA
jgi:hypothetical protein